LDIRERIGESRKLHNDDLLDDAKEGDIGKACRTHDRDDVRVNKG
jgi:hypothetical protein